MNWVTLYHCSLDGCPDIYERLEIMRDDHGVIHCRSVDPRADQRIELYRKMNIADAAIRPAVWTDIVKYLLFFDERRGLSGNITRDEAALDLLRVSFPSELLEYCLTSD